MTALEKLEQACDHCDITLLKEAIAEGVDVNFNRGELDETFYERMVGDWGCNSSNEISPVWSLKQMIEFTNILIDAGLDLNRISHDSSETYNLYWHVAKWGNNLDYLEYMLKKGMNPNYLGQDYSMLDELEGDIFAEECCGYPECASHLYNACRLSIAYGALPGEILGHKYPESESDLYKAAINLDADYFLARPSSITEFKPDAKMVQYGKYGFPKEFYFESEKFQNRLIEALDKIISAIGIENLDNNVLDNCAEDQYDLVLEHLLELGTNPNVNCFTASYWYVPSSALYTIEKRGGYYAPGIAEKMKSALIAAGAKSTPEHY